MAEVRTKPINENPQLSYLSPERLDFDPDNPRFGGMATQKTQPEIQAYLLGEPHYAAGLVDSLIENGYIDYEPLVAKRNADRFTVVEGNRRLAAIKEIRYHLDKYPLRKNDLDLVPVLVFPDKTDEEHRNDLRVYLGVRHLLGFREWPPISKAQFLDQESKSSGGLDQVIKEVRLSKTQARRFLVPFRLLKDAKVELPKGGEDFSVIGEALQRSGVKRFLQLDVDPKTLSIKSYEKKNLLVLLDYLYGPKKGNSKERETGAKVVNDTRDLSRLARVLESDEAAAMLQRKGNLDEAEILVDTREESLKRLAKVAKEIGSILKKLGSARSKEARTLADSYKQFGIAAKAFIAKNAKSSL